MIISLKYLLGEIGFFFYLIFLIPSRSKAKGFNCSFQTCPPSNVSTMFGIIISIMHKLAKPSKLHYTGTPEQPPAEDAENNNLK